MLLYRKGDVCIRYEETVSGFPLLVTQRTPNRVIAAVFCQTGGHRPENPTVMYRHSKENRAPDFMKRRRDVSTDTIERYLHNLYAVQPISSTRATLSGTAARRCWCRMASATDLDRCRSLAQNAEITVFRWKEPEELKQRTIDRVRSFLKAHVPIRAAGQ